MWSGFLKVGASVCIPLYCSRKQAVFQCNAKDIFVLCYSKELKSLLECSRESLGSKQPMDVFLCMCSVWGGVHVKVCMTVQTQANFKIEQKLQLFLSPPDLFLFISVH